MALTILQYIILGLIQGITEWLPMSSSGTLTLVMSNFFGITNIEEIIRNALILHLGTFFAALIYLRKDVAKLFKTLFKYRSSSKEEKSILNFLIISTIITGMIGIVILRLLLSLEGYFQITGKSITFAIGFLLLITGVIRLKAKNRGIKREADLGNSDGIILGAAQGFSSLPGISRSGITISALLLRKFNDTTALKLSFLMSLPIVLFGNLLLNLNDITFSSAAIYGIIASFVLGLITIHGLMKISRKINFAYFALAFAILMMLSVLI